MLPFLIAPALAVPALVAPADPPAASPVEGYRNSSELDAALREIVAANPDKARLDSIGRSRQGREILALRLGGAAPRPALLLTAGLDGSHLVSSETTVRLAKLLLATKSDLLDRVTIYVIARANPDAVDATLAGPAVQVGTLIPVDDDRDGVADEDPPTDLDGDGVITQMRVKNPKPPYVPSMVVDSAEARLMKAPDAAKGERPMYAVFTEGIDADSDGLIAEDGRGQVDLDHNFPHRYPEFAADAGPYQLSEPESKALVDFVLAHPDIVAAITYGGHDTLVKMPDTKDMDATGRTPQVYLAADHALYQELGKLYRETTGQKRSISADPAGSFWLWLADHRGLLSVATTVWGRPDVPKPEAPPTPAPDASAAPADAPPEAKQPPPPTLETPKDDVAAEHALDDDEHSGIQTAPATPAPQVPPTPATGAPTRGAPQDVPAGGPPGGGQRRRGGGGGRGGPGGGPGGGPAGPGAGAPEPKPGDEEAKEWLDYLDKTRGGAGFVTWHEIDHPLFGRVEIGGFNPLVRINPPSGELDGLAEKELAFVAALIERLPTLEVDPPVVTKLADGVWRIETAVANGGRLPTATRMGRTTRVGAPLVVRISTPVEKIVSGTRVRLVEGLDPGERIASSWIVRADAGETIELTMRCGVMGERTFRVRDGAVEAVAVPASTPESTEGKQ